MRQISGLRGFFVYLIRRLFWTLGGSGHRKYRSKTPEILLSPHHLENSRIYYDYYDPRWRNGPSYHPQGTVEPSSGGTGAWDRTYTVTSSGSKGVIYKSYRISSDMESQVSLPRSYTLPREFKYKRPKSRKAIRSEHFIHSTNSSDGESIIFLGHFCGFVHPTAALKRTVWRFSFLSMLLTQVMSIPAMTTMWMMLPLPACRRRYHPIRTPYRTRRRTVTATDSTRPSEAGGCLISTRRNFERRTNFRARP